MKGMKYLLIPGETSLTNSYLLLHRWYQHSRRRKDWEEECVIKQWKKGKTFLGIVGAGCRAQRSYEAIAMAVWIPLVLTGWRNMALSMLWEPGSTNCIVIKLN